MEKKMKTRKGKDGFDYPYTSPDLVVDATGKSNTTKFNEINSQFKDIAKQTIIEGNKIYLAKADGTKLDEGTDLPTSSSSGDNIFEEVSSEECTINETVNATALLQGTIGCGSPLAYDEEGNIIAYDEGNIDITERNYQNGICNLSQSGVINYDDTK